MPRKGQFSGHFIQCENCGKDIYQTRTQYSRAKHHFCSNQCQKEYQHKQKFEMRACETCGKEFEISKMSKQRFCSNECQHEWQKTIVGEKNPRYNRIIYPCDNCGKAVPVMPCEERLFKHHFCGDKCRQEWYSTVYSQSTEWKEESSKRAVSILARGLIPTTNTKPQLKINQLLDSLNIKYTNEKDFYYYSADNYLDDSNLIIEIMGDFWHASPLMYDFDNISETQRKRVKNDYLKEKYIYNNYGIRILYLWETDINKNIQLCEQLIRIYITQNGLLSNYHSFNYSIINDELCLNKEIIIPLQNRTQNSNINA